MLCPILRKIFFGPDPTPIPEPRLGPVRFVIANMIQALKVEQIDLLTNTNGPNHRTDKYDVMNRNGADRQLVIRRGQEFYILLYLNRQYEEENDNILINCYVDGVQPSFPDGTFVSFPMGNVGQSKNQWYATAHEKRNNSLVVKIFTPANIMIGKWKIEIHVMNKFFQRIGFSFKFDKPIYILFNPWCIDDDVYCEGENERQEYILAQTGYIWRVKRDEPTNWSYSQFAENILDCAVYLMTEIAKVNVKYRNDPIKVARKLTAAVNSNDDNGVLNGKWSKNDADYRYGTLPWAWTGSHEILQQYYWKKSSVSYGQCWVYAGVLTTVCRALGIPSRVITNYDSAHDVEGGLTIDYYFNEWAEEIDNQTDDSVWNFHVWNEVWMKRPDIGNGNYDGWQAIDATPQEKSDGIYCCGPMPVIAIKNGDILPAYDGKFIYSEVNADEVLWKRWGRNILGRYKYTKLMTINSETIGQNISTKAVGRWAREDITMNYKHSERSKSERQSFLAALNKCNYNCSLFYANKESTNVKFDFKVSTKSNETKNSYGATLTINNTTENKKHNVSVVCCTQLKYYTGRPIGDSQLVLNNDYIVGPGEVKVISIDLNRCIDNFRPKIIEDSNISVNCLVKDRENDFDHIMREFIWV